mmetsp:Transcript_16341/g.11770  ORF Transcript_16341/g.11770 Transcript_16341/m.11770 type:complete len:195 (+) Transcript_16341:439-1023(+)|eukprot:CAMPEP_0202962586 /NCGR_PEP_ID=MMETSP1396-20130829/6697_1 /ASSEMBLY_ACC=CAM_ASM_000872 /TAXON_ID= /ORGANISM="Pseudokeronopsis sp., Strain Brazil" /LENGTH=194 /DNA_ID=CAMNT_0049683289 /DNA_START=729 /DNA_END=1313 /DNA_ORIENTATION=+
MTKINFDNYTHQVQAILINPPWIGDADNKKGQKKNVSLEEFKQLRFSKNLMIDGIVFVWVEKELISDLIKFFESQDMAYVENICWIMLDEDKREEVDKTKSIDVSPAFASDDYQFIRKSKKTMLMFRRLQKKGATPLELRHQRTCDVYFDFKNFNLQNYKPNEYIYKLIETMLPKSMVDEDKKHLKMIELWAQD